MPADWRFASDIIKLAGVGTAHVSPEDAERQSETARSILADLRTRPGALLADEVGMGKTYVAMAVVASVILATRRLSRPVVVAVPNGLRQKWQRDWEQFKIHCVCNGALDWINDKYAHTPTEFFKLLDEKGKHKAHLLFITTGCFSRGLQDPWVKLAMIRLARSSTKLTNAQKLRVYRWSADLVRQFSNSRLTEDVVRRLLRADVTSWKQILVAEGILTADAANPVPEGLSNDAHRIKWSPVCSVLRELPGWRPASVKTSVRNEERRKFNSACDAVYKQWLNLARWQSPLLILDEAHHAKNDATRLSKLFRQESEDDVALLKNKFDRMLFLTATPFQLGHQELIRVLRSYAAVRWSSKAAPVGTPESFMSTMTEMEQALDRNRLAARRFDRLWGKLRLEMITPNTQAGKSEDQWILEWWRATESEPSDAWERELVEAYKDCAEKREAAERVLKPWLIRHNRPVYLPGSAKVKRRNVVAGRAIGLPVDDAFGRVEGIPIEQRVLLPFLITSRAQGQLAEYAGSRALFAEGLASSYEAFHHTRDGRHTAMDFDDGLVAAPTSAPWMVPTRWYEDQIEELIPSRDASRSERMAHPKMSATVKKAVDLWLAGEKVLVFCFYIQTAHALYEHLREEVNQRILKVAGEKLALNPRRQADAIQGRIARIVRRLSDPESPFHHEIQKLLETMLDKPEYAILRSNRERLMGVLQAYFRSPSFVARYLPLGDPLVRKALNERESRHEVIARGVRALRNAIVKETDASNQTYLGRVGQFLDFACELAERAERRLALSEDEITDESEDPLLEYLSAVSIYSQPRRPEQADQDEGESDTDDGSYRVMPLVRMVYGETKTDIRDRLMLAFNSPLFPEILITSSVMSEGVDLHRFCRHVIHHDLCWNPSTLEQRTGRLDRVRCKAEVCLQPIEVYEPFLAGSADEKMFRVLKDRERWFQIVMGQKFEFDEAHSDALSSRVPLPPELAESLMFKLNRWRPLPEDHKHGH